VTEEERQLVSALMVRLDGRQALSPDEFLHRFRHSTDGARLSLDLLNEAAADHNPEDVEYALIVGFTFGFTEQHLSVLLDLIDKDWHFAHEDIVSALADLRTPKSVEALYHATQWIPEYLDFDEARALAVKAIWGLGAIEGSAAQEKLDLLAGSDDPILRENAIYQLKLRRGEDPDA
jgi:hypothetical protein